MICRLLFERDKKDDWFRKRLVLAVNMQSVTVDAQTKPYQEVLLLQSNFPYIRFTRLIKLAPFEGQ